MEYVKLPGLKPIPKKPLFEFDIGDKVKVSIPALNHEGLKSIMADTGLFDFVDEMHKYDGKIFTISRKFEKEIRYSTKTGDQFKFNSYKFDNNGYIFRSFFLIPAATDDLEFLDLLKRNFEKILK